jgi:hypothetical protein
MEFNSGFKGLNRGCDRQRLSWRRNRAVYRELLLRNCSENSYFEDRSNGWFITLSDIYIYIYIYVFIFHTYNIPLYFTRCLSSLRHCATRQKIAGSTPHGVTGIFHWHSPSGRNMAPEIFLGGKGGRCLGLTTLPHLCAEKIWVHQLPATLRTWAGIA